MTQADVEALARVLRYDSATGHLVWRSTGKRAGTQHHTGHRRVAVFGKKYQEHRVAWALAYGEFPTGVLDHVNGVRWDNRLSNLREATPALNQLNTKARGSTHFDVSHGKWRARVKWRGTRRHVGWYDTKEEAEDACREFLAKAAARDECSEFLPSQASPTAQKHG